MSADPAGGRSDGASAIIVEVPEVVALVGRWPAIPEDSMPLGVPPHVTVLPYDGRFADVIPHLTLTRADPMTLGLVEVALRRELCPRLPLVVRVREVSLFVRSDDLRSRSQLFPLG